jgi:hypothetical protein
MPLGHPILGEFKYDTKVVYLFLFLFSVNIKPPMHLFGFSLAWGWQYTKQDKAHCVIGLITTDL